MKTIPFSIYTTAYNLNSGLFDWRTAITRFANFADQVVVATNNSTDYLLLNTLANDKIKVLMFNIPFSDYAFDGKLKNAALQACDHEYCVLLDLDEYIPEDQKESWQNLIKNFSSDINEKLKCVLIPVINICRDINSYKDIGYKFYLHKKTGTYRGIISSALLENGRIDITKSDTTELIDENGNLVPSAYLISPFLDDEFKLMMMGKHNIYVVHTGYLDPKVRVGQNSFWKPHWENRAGHKVGDIALTEDELNQITVKPHGLRI